MQDIGPQKMPSSPSRIDAQTKAVKKELGSIKTLVSPLDYTELSNMADRYVWPDSPETFFGSCSVTGRFCDRIGFVPIVDAELDLVCIAPKEKAELLARLINTYKTVNHG